MSRSQIIWTFRKLWKQKLTTSINLIGLIIGISCSLLLLMYVRYEHSFDQFIPEAESTYRLLTKGTGSDARTFALSTNAANEQLSSEFPQLKSVVKLRDMRYDMSPSNDHGKKSNVRFYFASAEFFEFFGFPLIHGDAGSVLTNPSSIVLSVETANKLFGRTDVVGEVVTVHASFISKYQKELTVTGVSNATAPSHMKFEAVIPWQMTNPEGDVIADWFFGRSHYSYVKTVPGAGIDEVVTGLNAQLAEREENPDYEYLFQPLEDIYLGSSDISSSYFFSGNPTVLNALYYIALSILFIACINYLNLQTVLSSRYRMETGIRKVLGATRRHLLTQTLFESFILVVVAAAMSVLLIDLSLPYFNRLTDKSFETQMILQPEYLSIFAMLISGAVLVAGLYPVFSMRKFNAVNVLKRSSSKGQKAGKLRTTLMLLQFAVSIVLIGVTYLIHQQSQFIQEKEVGYNQEDVLTIYVGNETSESKIRAFKSEVENHSAVHNSSLTTDILGTGSTNNAGSVYNALSLSDRSPSSIFGIDPAFIDTYEIKLQLGRDFVANQASDSNAVIVNQSLVNALNLDDPLGSTIALYQPDGPKYRIIGVVADFHFEKLHNEITPAVMRLASRNLWRLSVRLNPADREAALAHIQEKWEAFQPNAAFEYRFVGEGLQGFYQTENKVFSAITIFSVISLVLTLLGLFAMSLFSVENRLKEIGIRKVLGATIASLVGLIYKEFAKVLVLAGVLATPLVYYLGSSWLGRFAYRIDMSVLPLMLAILIATIVTVLIVSWVARKAAGTNPVELIRNE